MVKNKYTIVILVAFMILSKVVSYPAVTDSTLKKEEKQDSSFGLPFLEFKNGGVRVNFGGYHAEAGLGGLLGAPGTTGGLYAGAGTPSGAHASADLGGFLNGQRNNGGGLGARAGLGNGGPEAAAGLNGNLDGIDGSKSGGQLYTATSNAGKTKINIKRLTPDRSNIQSVSATKNDPEDLTRNSMTNVDVNVNNNSELKRREIDVHDANINFIEPALTTPIASDVTTYTYANRRCRRKRICNNLRKVVIQQQLPLSQVPVNFADEIVSPYASSPEKLIADNANLGGLQGANTGYKDIAVVPGPAPILPGSSLTPGNVKPRGTLFDDIFNIPISVLSAVNQLLNNKAG